MRDNPQLPQPIRSAVRFAQLSRDCLTFAEQREEKNRSFFAREISDDPVAAAFFLAASGEADFAGSAT